MFKSTGCSERERFERYLDAVRPSWREGGYRNNLLTEQMWRVWQRVVDNEEQDNEHVPAAI